VLGIALIGSTSQALYFTSIGPKECCRSHCHRGQATSDADADRCCAVHLGVLPAALAATTPDLHHVFAAVGTVAPAVVHAAPIDLSVGPAPNVLRRGSPPGTLVAAHTALLI
jgi:hypothetical protein